MQKILSLEEYVRNRQGISFNRLIKEIESMVRSYSHVKLIIHPQFGPAWLGYVRKRKEKRYFLIEYSIGYPNWRPYFYTLEEHSGVLNHDKNMIGRHPYRGKGLCLYTHDGGPNSWNEELTAADCISRYIEYVNNRGFGILDYQDLEDRLTIPGRRSDEAKYFITYEAYQILREERVGEFFCKVLRKNPELLLITEIQNLDGNRISLDTSWFVTHEIWKSFENIKKGVFLKSKFQEIHEDWNSKVLNTFIQKKGLDTNSDLVLFIPDNEKFTPVILETKPNQVNYYLDLLNPLDLFKRVDGIMKAEREIIKNKKILFLGLGSIGSKIALSLARAGIMNFFLYDNDIFKIENIVRHTGDTKDLYRPKVDIVKSQINSINPDSNVKVFHANPFSEGNIDTFRTILGKSDLVICSVGIFETEFKLNSELIALKKSCVFVAALGNASYGEIFRVIPDQTACVNCIDLNNNENPDRFPILSEETGTEVPRKEGYREGGIPGIDIDISIIAGIGARMSLQTLFEQNGIMSTIYPPCQGDFLFWSNHKGWIFGDSSLIPEWIHHPRNPYCKICSNLESTPTEIKIDEKVKKLFEKAMDPKRFK